MGLKSLPKHSAEYLLEVVMRRYENRSTIRYRRRFLEPDWQRLHKAGQAQLFQGLIEDLVIHIYFRLCCGFQWWEQSSRG